MPPPGSTPQKKSDISVTDIRKHLCHIRKMWMDHSAQKPFFLSTPLTEEMTVGEFCFLFVCRDK